MKKQKENLTLISRHEEQATAAIENWKKLAQETTDLIKYFNEIPLLSEVKTEAQVLEFLKDPVKYFRKRIMFDIKFSSKIQPPPEGIAELYKIPYKEIVQVLGGCQVTDLKYYLFDGNTQAITFDGKHTAAIQKSFYSYAQTPAESKAIIEIRKLCDLLNKHCDRWDVASDSMHTVANNLGLKVDYLPGSKSTDRRKYEFKEHITVTRSKLEYEQAHGL